MTPPPAIDPDGVLSPPRAEADGAAAGSVRAVVGRAALVIVAATLTGRVLGLVRDIVVAYFFGAQAETDAFFLAYKVPYLLALVVGGAMVAAFVPLFSYRVATGRKPEALSLFVNMGKVACVVMVVVTIVLVVLAPWIIPLVGFGFELSHQGPGRLSLPDPHDRVCLCRAHRVSDGHAQLAAEIRDGRLRPRYRDGGDPRHHRCLRGTSWHHRSRHRHGGRMGRRSGGGGLWYPRPGGALPGPGPMARPGSARSRGDDLAGSHRIGGGSHLHLLHPDPWLSARGRLRFQLELRRQVVPAPPGSLCSGDNRAHLPPAFRASGCQSSRPGEGHLIVCADG